MLLGSHIVAMWHLDIKHNIILSCQFVLFVESMHTLYMLFVE